MQACAPGKLILSGEHSVVYGAPAIALAVNRHVTVSAQLTSDNQLHWQLENTGQQDVIAWSDLRQLVAHLDQRFAEFDAGCLSAADILEAPHQLVLYALAQALPDDFEQGIELTVSSELPLGAGMGSSAAVSAAVLQLGYRLTGTSVESDLLFQTVRYCERLCHGRGGLIDSAAVSYGGLIRIQNGQADPLPLHLGAGWYYIHTGIPEAGTGECVEQVRARHGDSDIWQQFTETTENLIAVLESSGNPSEQIRANHRLLVDIGVVPQIVQGFIGQIEILGGAAKVSGAGSVRGEHGGAVIAYAPGTDIQNGIEALCQQTGFTYMAIEEDKQGARSLG